MKSITIAEVLRGTKPGRIQSVGYMQILPLLSDLIDDRFTTPDNVETATLDYGIVLAKNNSDNMTILPFGTAIIIDKRAQNHALPKSTLIKGKSQVKIDTAACIQDSQSGTIPMGKHPLSIIPWALKEAALLTRNINRGDNSRSYEKLWGVIKEFNTKLGLQVCGHLELYLERFKDVLDDFIAQFEITRNQIGAIILLNGCVVAIERTPNYKYWKSIWKPLIRECYGSLALQFVRDMGPNPPLPQTQVPLKSQKVTSIQDISKALNETRIKEEKIIKSIIRKFVKDKFNIEQEEKDGSITVENLTHKQFIGQIVRDDDAIVYASLITRDAWSRKHKWYEADEFTI
jgi:hypothetical protein